jgi:hypothetical protein
MSGIDAAAVCITEVCTAPFCEASVYSDVVDVQLSFQ